MSETLSDINTSPPAAASERTVAEILEAKKKKAQGAVGSP